MSAAEARDAAAPPSGRRAGVVSAAELGVAVAGAGVCGVCGVCGGGVAETGAASALTDAAAASSVGAAPPSTASAPAASTGAAGGGGGDASAVVADVIASCNQSKEWKRYQPTVHSVPLFSVSALKG